MGNTTGYFGDQANLSFERKAPGNTTPIVLAAGKRNRTSLTLQNLGSVGVYIGVLATISSSAHSGLLGASAQVVFTGAAAQSVIYGVAASATGDISVIEAVS